MPLDMRERRVLSQIIDRSDFMPKKPEDSAVDGPGNTDYLLVSNNPREPLLKTMLAEMEADAAARDALLPEYEKAKDAYARANSRLNHVTEEIRQRNARIGDTRKAMLALQARRTVTP